MSYERRWWAVVAVSLSIFLVALDMTIVALALPYIARHFHLAASLTSTVTLSYSVPLTLLILPCGVVITRFRPLTSFLVAVLGFCVGSIICGLAQDFAFLLLGRVIQGIFGSVIPTLGVAGAVTVVSPAERGRAMGIITMLAPLGAVAGPGIGGLLLNYWGWSAIFFVNVPVCLLAVLLACLSLRGVTFDASPSGSGLRHLGSLLSRMQFVWALLTLLCSATIGGALFYLLPFDLSNLQHFAPSTSGLILLCMPLGMAIMGPLGGILTDRYGIKPFILAGVTLLLVGVSILTLAVGHPTSGPDLVWRLLLVGLGMGLFNGPNQTLLMSIGSRETMGAASALSGMGRNIGFVCGPLIVSIAWSFLGGTVAQMVGGMLLLVGLGVMDLVFVWLSIRTGLATALEDTASDAVVSAVQPVASSVE